MTQETLDELIENAEYQYDKEISEICSRIRSVVIKPYCDKYNLKFSAGMGIFSFEDANGRDYMFDFENGPGDYKQILSLLSTTDPKSGCSIGSFCESYTPKNFIS